MVGWLWCWWPPELLSQSIVVPYPAPGPCPGDSMWKCWEPTDNLSTKTGALQDRLPNVYDPVIESNIRKVKLGHIADEGCSDNSWKFRGKQFCVVIKSLTFTYKLPIQMNFHATFRTIVASYGKQFARFRLSRWQVPCYNATLWTIHLNVTLKMTVYLMFINTW
jgi:hypothetical protein